MAPTQEEEIVLGIASPVTSYHKRTHDDLEPDSQPLAPELNGNSDSGSVKKIDDQEEDAEAKRQRLDDTPANLVATENGHQQRDNEVGVQPAVQNLTPVEDEHQQVVAEETGLTEEAPKQVNDEELAAEDKQTDVAEHTADDDTKLENAEEKASEDEPKKHPEELDAPAGDGSQHKVVASAQNEDTSGAKSMSRKMEVPNRQIISQNHLNLVVVNNVPLFFNMRDGPYMLTLRLLHQYLDIMKKLQVGRGAIRFVLSGANIMCPGLTSPGGYLDEEVAAERPVTLMAEGKQHALAIGFTKMSAKDIKAINKGIGVDNMHYLNDGLWKVGVLIGKAGDTIRFLQYNSGARIQITRDVDADPYSGTRPVELIGTLDNITKAEKLIKDVIAEADAGGSPALIARGFNTVQATRAGQQIQIQVPNEKVGLITGKGGVTIKNLQTRSGARIQVVDIHEHPSIYLERSWI